MNNDNRDIELKNRMLTGQVIALNNKVAMMESIIKKYRDTEAAGEQEFEARDAQLKAAIDKAVEYKNDLDKEKSRADKWKSLYNLECREHELTKEKLSVSEQNLFSVTKDLHSMADECAQISEKKKKAEDLVDQCEKNNIDFDSIIRLFQLRVFNSNSDRSSFLNSNLELDEQMVEELGMQKYINQMLSDNMDQMYVNGNDLVKTGEAACKDAGTDIVPVHKKASKSQKGLSKPRCTYDAKIKETHGIDLSNFKDKKVKIMKGKGKNGKNCWNICLMEYVHGYIVKKVYEIAHCNVKGENPQNSKYPSMLIDHCPITPSFFRMYLEMKFVHNVSENQILDILEGMGCKVSQSTLNDWAHKGMALLRSMFEDIMIVKVRMAKMTHNDGTRFDVRSRESKNAPFKYHTEYVQAVLAPEVRTVVMLYEEGSRSHEVQENLIFKGSDIRAFIADRYSGYGAIVKDIEEYHLQRAACWFHARHYFADAYVSDHRMAQIITWINALFLIERQSDVLGHTPKERLNYRNLYSRRVVNKIMKKLQEIRAAGSEYGKLVQRAVDYVLDDEDAYKVFLINPMIPLSNNAAERMFRHIAMGRRIWMHISSHEAAKNITFVFSLIESCRLNNLNFGDYIEDVLNRVLAGDKNFESMIPCNYETNAEELETQVLKKA